MNPTSNDSDSSGNHDSNQIPSACDIDSSKSGLVERKRPSQNITDSDVKNKIQCVRFMLDHSSSMIKDSSELFCETICQIINPIISNDHHHSDEPSERPRKHVGEETCNGIGPEHQDCFPGVAKSAKMGTVSDTYVSAWNTHACKSQLLNSNVSSSVGQDGFICVGEVPLKDATIDRKKLISNDSIFNNEGKCCTSCTTV